MKSHTDFLNPVLRTPVDRRVLGHLGTGDTREPKRMEISMEA